MIKTEKKLQKIYLAYNNLLTAQVLWLAHSQFLSIIFLKEFIKVNANTSTIIEKCETCGITYKACECFVKCTNFKDDLIE